MPREIPFFIEGRVAQIVGETAIVRVPNGNLYHVYSYTPGIDFSNIAIDKRIVCEVTSVLTRVFSARLVE